MEQTNKYAAECMGLEKFDKWNKVTVEELCAYMGFMLLVGIVHLPSLYDYWKNDEVYHYSPIADKICDDSLQGTVHLEAVHASEASATRNQGVGESRSFQWVCICFPGIYWETRRHS